MEKHKIIILLIIIRLLHRGYTFSISANYGRIIINSDVNCTILLNGTTLPTVSNVVPGLHYGLIEYDCGHNKGFLLSKPECYECGIYCPQNDRLLNCRQFGLPYFLGCATAFIISITIAIVMHKWGFNLLHVLISSLKNKRKTRRENKYIKYIAKYNKDQTANAPQVESVIEENTPKMNTQKYPSLSQIAVGTLLLTADRTYACDRTLFMHSNGQICDRIKCQDINSYSFNIGIGKTICFNTPGREMMKFKIENTKEITTYQELYMTSDYEIELESTSSCKQVGLCYKENCYKGAKHPDFRNLTKVYGYDCESEGLGCDFMCWHKYACTWYMWWFRNIGMKATIFKQVYSVWSFDLLVSFKDTTRTYSFNSELTQHDLDIGKLFSIDNMPINVNNVIKINLYKTNYLLRDGFSFYEVTANDINNLTPGRIGDYQISLNNEQSIYKTNEVDCRTSGCSVKCSSPEPSLRIFRSLKHKKIVDEYSISDDHTVRTLKHMPMTISLSIGNIEFKNLFVEPANCDFEILHTFGCIGCDRYPYVVLQATKIINYGVLPFISNCSFNIKTLSCGNNVNKLIPAKEYRNCDIYIPSTNKSLNMEFNYEFFGDLSIPEDIYSHDNGYKGIIKSIAENPNFLDTLTYSMFAFTGVGLLCSIITKVALRAIAIRESKKLEQQVKESLPC